MNLTIEISWWIVPLVATLTAFIWAWTQTSEPDSTAALNLIGPVVFLLYYGLATIVSLIAWLAWAVIS